MAHLNTIDPPLYKVLKDFCQFPDSSSLSLVGGTALSLQTGHRKSDDLDFFTDRSFDIVELKNAILTYNPGVAFLSETREGVSFSLPLPAEEHALIEAFLKDNHFLVTSPSDYNALGAGTTQLYNTRFVYNLKRHGEFKLGNRSFHFVRNPYGPSKLTSEFLLVDLVNNLEHLAEDQAIVMDRVKDKAREMDPVSLRKMANRVGKVRTRKLFNALLTA